MNTEHKKLYRRWRDLLLQQVKGICMECTDPRKEKAKLDFDNPLNCGCRCERVEGVLTRVEEIDKDL